ncbi:DUF3551 domain-containing protein [Bradyrhizobium sp. WSM 1738]|uniref:DUF3551 domain-containing protein n=1 Tax=Bradyrhizobium hereditatis TaxID=2821405 RepID=UPI001CE2DD0F|nr:DUF3551 domain-containing protein [Bradyrhizobium hereditatis]MCA6113768.1 DUF3551 domain-containing protein [Bradyrhizobium hereditatis]
MKLSHAVAAAIALTAATITLAAPARAQTYDPSYPVCLQVYQGIVDYYFECHYRTMAQCQMSASGRAAQCVVNPYYGGPKSRRQRQRSYDRY